MDDLQKSLSLEKVQYRDVMVSGPTSSRFAHPTRIGVETRCRWDYGQQGATRTIDDPYCIFQYTLKGVGAFSDDKGRYLLPEGTGFLCESHDPRIAYSFPKEATEPWTFFYMSICSDPVGPLLREFGNRFGRVVSMPKSSAIMRRCLHLACDWESILFMSASEANALILDLISALTSASTGELESAEDLLLKQIQSLIQQRIPEGRLDLIELADDLGMSRGHLCRFFRHHTGLSPYQYILRKQMMLACQWLLDEQLSVKEVAHQLGFSTPANFIRSFKQVTGMTTREFLRQGLLPRL